MISLYLDFDGVLIDSATEAPSVFRETLTYFFEGVKDDSLFECVNGLSIDKIAETLFIKLEGNIKSSHIAIKKEDIAKFIEDRWKEHYKNLSINTQICKEIEFLNSVGIKLVLATSASEELIFNSIKPIRKFFDCVIDSSLIRPSKKDSTFWRNEIISSNESSFKYLLIDDNPDVIRAASTANFGVSLHKYGQSLFHSVANCLLSISEAPVTARLSHDIEFKSSSLGLQSDQLERLKEDWDNHVSANPATFDGKMCFIDCIKYTKSGLTTISGQQLSYRYRLLDPPCFSLAVQCIIISSNKFLIGKRSKFNSDETFKYEFVPSGGVEELSSKGIKNIIYKEIIEETGIIREEILKIKPFGWCIDFKHMVIDIIYEVMISPLEMINPSQEHVELKWVDISDLLTFNKSFFTLSSDAYLKLKVG